MRYPIAPLIEEASSKSPNEIIEGIVRLLDSDDVQEIRASRDVKHYQHCALARVNGNLAEARRRRSISTYSGRPSLRDVFFRIDISALRTDASTSMTSSATPARPLTPESPPWTFNSSVIRPVPRNPPDSANRSTLTTTLVSSKTEPRTPTSPIIQFPTAPPPASPVMEGVPALFSARTNTLQPVTEPSLAHSSPRTDPLNVYPPTRPHHAMYPTPPPVPVFVTVMTGYGQDYGYGPPLPSPMATPVYPTTMPSGGDLHSYGTPLRAPPSLVSHGGRTSSPPDSAARTASGCDGMDTGSPPLDPAGEAPASVAEMSDDGPPSYPTPPPLAVDHPALETRCTMEEDALREHVDGECEQLIEEDAVAAVPAASSSPSTTAPPPPRILGDVIGESGLDVVEDTADSTRVEADPIAAPSDILFDVDRETITASPLTPLFADDRTPTSDGPMVIPADASATAAPYATLPDRALPAVAIVDIPDASPAVRVPATEYIQDPRKPLIIMPSPPLEPSSPSPIEPVPPFATFQLALPSMSPFPTVELVNKFSAPDRARNSDHVSEDLPGGPMLDVALQLAVEPLRRAFVTSAHIPDTLPLELSYKLIDGYLRRSSAPSPSFISRHSGISELVSSAPLMRGQRRRRAKAKRRTNRKMKQLSTISAPPADSAALSDAQIVMLLRMVDSRVVS